MMNVKWKKEEFQHWYFCKEKGKTLYRTNFCYVEFIQHETTMLLIKKDFFFNEIRKKNSSVENIISSSVNVFICKLVQTRIIQDYSFGLFLCFVVVLNNKLYVFKIY